MSGSADRKVFLRRATNQGVRAPGLLTMMMETTHQADGNQHDEHQTALYARTRLPMLRLAFLLTGSAVVAEELVQDAYEQVVRRWVQIDEPGGYLRVAVVNGARSWGRRRRHIPAEPEAHWPDLGADVIAVRAALADLRHDEREVLVLRYYAGMSDGQIATMTGRPIGTVKSMIHRGIRKMREVLT